MKIGAQLQKQRKLHNLSQDDLAEKLGISRQAVSRWENGATLPSFSNILAISELFNLSLDELIKGDTNLMNRLENNNKLIRLLIAVICGLVLAIVIWGLSKVTGIYANTFFKIVMSFGILGSGILLLRSIKWNEIKRVITKQTIFWTAVFIMLRLIPIIDNFIKGFNTGYHSLH